MNGNKPGKCWACGGGASLFEKGWAGSYYCNCDDMTCGVRGPYADTEAKAVAKWDMPRLLKERYEAEKAMFKAKKNYDYGEHSRLSELTGTLSLDYDIAKKIAEAINE